MLGAGALKREAIELMLTSPYNQQREQAHLGLGSCKGQESHNWDWGQVRGQGSRNWDFGQVSGQGHTPGTGVSERTGAR